MKTIQCTTCKIAVDETMTHCPLCGKYLGHHVYNEQEEPYPLPNYRQLRITHERIAFFSFLALSFVATAVAILVNWLIAPQQAWSIYAIVGIVYLWILIGHTIISSSTVGQKLIYQEFAVIGFAIVVDYLTGWTMFSINYVLPLLTALLQASLTIIVYASSHAKKHDLLKLLSFTFIGLIPIIFYAFGWSTILWPALASTAVSILSFGSLAIARFPAIWSDLKGKFHI